MPATIPVISLGDAGPGALRAAITQANLDAAPDTITFDPSVRGTITLVSTLPDLATAIDIEGPGASALTVARSGVTGTPDFRIFTVPAGAVVTISGLTITGGHVTAPAFGGGINNSGTLTLTDSAISGNSAAGLIDLSSDPGIGSGGHGGGIDNSGSLSVINTTIADNSAAGIFGVHGGPGGAGGGINNSGTLTVTDSAITGNGAGAGFGGIIEGGGGGSGSGGGIANFGSLTVTDTTIAQNQVSASIGASGSGGGIDNSGTLTVDHATIAGNIAEPALVFIGRAGFGGGIATGELLTTPTSAVSNSLFQNNQGGNVAVCSGGDFRSLGHNLFSDVPAVKLDPTDLTNADPLLGPLADNGGPTCTQALLPGSPAIDAGVTVAGVTVDQRGVSRPQGKAPDLGAFESRGFTLSVGGGGQTALIHSPFPAPLVVAVASPFGEPVAGGRVTFTAPTTGPSATFTGNPATLDANGRASVHATADGLAGTYDVTARVAGTESVALTLTNAVVPPTVVRLQRFGIHAQPTRLVLYFSAALNPATAQDARNYTIVGPGGGFIGVDAAVYVPSARAVVLSPHRKLNIHYPYRLTVNGQPGGVTGASGTLLDGAGNGQPGSNYVTTVDRSDLVLPGRFPLTESVARRAGRSSATGFHPAGTQTGRFLR